MRRTALATTPLALPTIVTSVRSYANKPTAGAITSTWAPPAAGPAGLTSYQVTVSPSIAISPKATNSGIEYEFGV